MNTRDISPILATLMRELTLGSPDPGADTYMLNRGDGGLLASLDKLSARSASSTAGGGSIASHADHLRYGLALLNRWARGEPSPWKDADWTLSWKKSNVSDNEWNALRAELRREANDWIAALAAPREVEPREGTWVAGSVAHLAYHLGAIRQIDRAARGPTAEDERRAEQEIARRRASG